MASVSNTGSLIAYLHPVVIMNISDHWTRLKVQNTGDQQVIGALIGKQEGRNIEIMSSFELLFDRVEGDIIIDKEYYFQKEAQFKQVFPDLDFIGWYTIGDVPNDSDIKVQQQICEINESPIFLKLNPYSPHSKLPVNMYETVIDIVNGEAKMLFIDLNYSIKTEEAERIGLDHIATLSSVTEGPECQSSVISELLSCQMNAVKMLRERINIVLAYVNDTHKGIIPWNDEILRDINNLCHRLPVVNNKRYSDDYYRLNNDIALATYLSTITKVTNTLNEFVQRFNIFYEHHGMSRKIRAAFIIKKDDLVL
ncbi:COP9 signalosome complex subunit 6 [Tetranychus urticae]|uniref:COP9 signalosome complex subunit 6 n=1 Tax=Tetranychus urticae TaxID=32264 RepID=T1L3U8_TETUR|nr:COP9 signalosome complex subunit 6 [Tetranychus urticae]XP_015793470.1 COP9 signalosome complex subunit 6 [Tetranychus urticae]